MKKLTALALMLALTLTCITGAFATAYPSGNAYYDSTSVACVPSAASPKSVKNSVEAELKAAMAALDSSYHDNSGVVPEQEVRLNRERLAAQWLVNGEYPKTASGETYGPALASIVGYDPDLVAAVNKDGLHGYLRRAEMDPEIYNAEDYAKYQAELKANDYKFPMYDLEENIIGYFDICKGEPIVPDAASLEEAMKAVEAGMGGNQPLEPGAELKAAMAALDSSYNDPSCCDDTETISPQTAREYQISLWLVDGEYRRTASGKTYGSTMMFDVVGYNPDLISVQNKDRLHGYVKNEDLNPELNNAADWARYNATLEANDYKFPMYDLEENIIGYFDICKSPNPFR